MSEYVLPANTREGVLVSDPCAASFASFLFGTGPTLNLLELLPFFPSPDRRSFTISALHLAKYYMYARQTPLRSVMSYYRTDKTAGAMSRVCKDGR